MNYSSVFSFNYNKLNMDIKEIEIDAPWGKIAAKLWGNSENPHIIVTHGIMDNAGSFDGLIPLLPNCFYYICVDLPGHGKSTHLPSHLPIFTASYLIAYSVIMDYFKKRKYIIMGHSYGGQIGCMYAQIYPEKVEKLILLDTLHLITLNADYLMDALEDRLLKKYFKLEEQLKQKSPPQYSYETIIEKIIAGRAFPFNRRAAINLAKRSAKSVGDDKYEITTDQRLKFMLNPMHDSEYAIKTLVSHPLYCKTLIVLAKDSELQRRLITPIYEFFKTKKNVDIKYVEGTHDVHQMEPNTVAPFVTDFLLNTTCKL